MSFSQPHPLQANGASSSGNYQDHQESTKYDRVVRIPAERSQSQMSSARGGHRQPTEHPNDRPYSAESNGADGFSRLTQDMENLALHTPVESSESRDLYHIRMPRTQPPNAAMTQSHQLVWNWNSSPPGEDDSFVIDNCSESFSSSASFLNGDLGRSGLEHDSSDEETGLQKSLVGIQSPPVVIGARACSRQSSSGSADSSLSFHTVYPSDAYPRRPHPPRQDDPGRVQPPNRPQPLGPAGPHHHPLRSQTTTSTEPYFARSQSHPEVTRSSGQSGVRQINQNADQASRDGHAEKPTSVFITYAEEQQNPAFKRLVLQLTRTLLSNGVHVRLDMLESTLMSMSVSSWLDDNIQKCDFVIVCISPSYRSEVEQHVLPETPDPHSLHTRYIYNRLLTEYIQNGSRNYRFIPVLIGGATRRDLPSLCLDTTVYEWPQHYESIIYRLFKKEKYIQPAVGPPPQCTVETYGSHEATQPGGQ